MATELIFAEIVITRIPDSYLFQHPGGHTEIITDTELEEEQNKLNRVIEEAQEISQTYEVLREAIQELE
jgi:hypothetical protein